ncbi:MAG TPA: iron-containing alcohol dehydrogenase [Vicinamibacterales bacterium]|nr:iron-containing alcohol dehydrogenase [Vicinamibacterales bacterium]
MVAFDFQPRSRVVFGAGSSNRAGQLARDLGFRRTLVVADPGIREAGITPRVLEALTAANVETFPFEGFGINPDNTMVEAGAGFARPLGIDSIVAVGGGSSLDCAKGINFILRNGGTMADYRGYGKASTPLLPMIGIPTTAGTGSEAQSYAVIADAKTRLKMACGDPSAAFRVAILDPDLTITAPRHITAMAGYDAIAHAVETAVTSKRTPLSDTFSHQAWALLSEAFERVLLHPTDADARSGMLLGAHLAGMAIEQSMLGAAHACANPLTARFNVAHGLALAIVLPHVVRWNAPAARDRYAALLGAPRRRARDEDPAETLARRLEDFARASHMAITLSDAGVTADAISDLAGLAAQQWTGTFNPRPFDAKGAAEIYRAAM